MAKFEMVVTREIRLRVEVTDDITEEEAADIVVADTRRQGVAWSAPEVEHRRIHRMSDVAWVLSRDGLRRAVVADEREETER